MMNLQGADASFHALEQQYRRDGQVEPLSPRGQLHPEVQMALARAHAIRSLEQCSFYHTMEFSGGPVVRGAWDLREREREYLGYIDFNGTRVLEFGPASGHLTFFMERNGASVVAFDLPPGFGPEILPVAGADANAARSRGAEFVSAIRKSWWYSREALAARAAVVYGNIYQLPDDIGTFDASIFGCILLHLASPFRALEQAARVTEKAIIVTEVLPLNLPPHEATAEFHPGNDPTNLVSWWGLTPGVVTRMLHVLGFGETDVIFHAQRLHLDFDFANQDQAYTITEIPMFTVVGEKIQGPRIGRSGDYIRRDRREEAPAMASGTVGQSRRRVFGGAMRRARILLEAFRPKR